MIVPVNRTFSKSNASSLNKKLDDITLHISKQIEMLQKARIESITIEYAIDCISKFGIGKLRANTNEYNPKMSVQRIRLLYLFNDRYPCKPGLPESNSST